MLLQTVLLWGLVAGMQAASSKRGFCMGFRQHYHCGDSNALTGSTWWYDWGRMHNEHTQHHCPNNFHGEYVPMVWGHFNHDQGNVTLSFPPGTKHILGFNEPNNKHQSNISPPEAARLWKELESLAHGIKLVSPAPYRCHGSPDCLMDSFQWYDEFFAACHGCRVDALAAHSYTCNAHQDMNYLGSLHNKYHLKIWLTEFSCPHTSDEAKVESYMREVVTLLEKAPFVERYAWYITRQQSTGFLSPAISLLEPTSSNTTALGNLYNHL